MPYSAVTQPRALAAQKPRNRVVHRRGADDACIPALDQDRAVGVLDVVAGNADRSEFVRCERALGRMWLDLHLQD